MYDILFIHSFYQITRKTVKETDYECDTKEQTEVYNYEYRYMTKDMLCRNINTKVGLKGEVRQRSGQTRYESIYLKIVACF